MQCGRLTGGTTHGPVVQLVRTLACHARGRGFEPHPGRHKICGFSSSGRAPPCQGGGSEFEPRNPLHFFRHHSQAVRQRSAKPLFPGSIPGGASKNRQYSTQERCRFFSRLCFLAGGAAGCVPGCVPKYPGQRNKHPRYPHGSASTASGGTMRRKNTVFCAWGRIFSLSSTQFSFFVDDSSREIWYIKEDRRAGKSLVALARPAIGDGPRKGYPFPVGALLQPKGRRQARAAGSPGADHPGNTI